MNIIRQSRRRISSLGKNLSGEFPSVYKVEDVEDGWYGWWEKNGYFQPSKEENEKPRFSVLLPPPNVTGTLHLGHALTVSIQDTLVRWNRMRGLQTIWIPGSDHAGIATQAIVEKHLRFTKTLDRDSIDRDSLIREAQAWKREKSGRIFMQLRRLGASLDWTQEYFTLDESRDFAVTEAFLSLYDKGLIYRGNFLVNWSCSLSSTISDIEIDWLDISKKTKVPVPGYENPVIFGVMYDIAYKVANNTEEEIVISTTRPETIPGDVAVAVHPSDSRYTKYIGLKLQHPLNSERLIPVIADECVDPSLGTGALKITPGHDIKDFDVGARHSLPTLNILDSRGGLIFPEDPSLHGKPRFFARDLILTKIKEQSLLRNIRDDHSMKIPICSRSGDIIEKVIRPQWFLKTKNMLKSAKRLVEEDSVLEIEPQQFVKHWFRWLNNEIDWCISRQLWWGHRIPMWNCVFSDGMSEWIPGRSEEDVRRRCNGRNIVTLYQDEDVLDTWFSSALLPLSSLGWPNLNDDRLRRYFPLSLMETGHDILFFWVARMVMIGIELCGQTPFNKVMLHGLVCDGQGRKMSKSIGNVIDPMYVIDGISLEKMNLNVKNNHESGFLTKDEMRKAISGLKKDFPNGIPKIGTDGLRFGLLYYDVQAETINVDVNLFKNSGAFCNKLWQLSRFLMIADDRSRQIIDDSPKTEVIRENEVYNLEDRWILSRCGFAINSVDKSMRNNRFVEATRTLRTFMYSELCDVYVEIIKPTLLDPNHVDFGRSYRTLKLCILTGMKLLHPFMPYITEEIYQRIGYRFGQAPSSIMLEPYPNPAEWDSVIDLRLSDKMDRCLKIVRAIRNSKSLYDLTNKDLPDVVVLTNDVEELSEWEKVIRTLGFIGKISFLPHLSESESSLCWTEKKVADTGDVVKLRGVLDVEKEQRRIQERLSLLRKDAIKFQALLDHRRKGKKAQAKLCEIKLEEDELLKKINQLNLLSIKKGNN